MWLQFTANVDESVAEQVSDAFMELGALSVSFEDAGDQPLYEPLPGETPLWELTRIIALFDEDAVNDDIYLTLNSAFPGKLHNWERVTVEDRAWERVWMEHFHPMQFGQRLWVIPTGFDYPEGDFVSVLLDPGLAFGTGTHPTTALCLTWLEGQNLSGMNIMDYGCGSGILGIAALKLGASSVVGVDIDSQALDASRENSRKNGVDHCITLKLPGEIDKQPEAYDIVVANILAGPLVELAPELTSGIKLGGHLVLSGLLANQVDNVMSAYKSCIDFSEIRQQEDWVMLAGKKIG